MNQSMTTDQAVSAAFAHYRAGDLAQANHICAQVLATKPDHAAALYIGALTAWQSGNRSEAFELMKRAVTAAPRNLEYVYNLGVMCEELKYLEHALACFEQTRQIDPRRFEAHFKTAFILGELNRLRESLAVYQEALGIKPDAAMVYSNMGDLYCRLGLYEDARAVLEKAISLGNDAPSTHKSLGDAYLVLEQRTRALASYEKALELQPEYFEARLGAGNCHLLLGNDKAARVAYNRAEESNPKSLIPLWGNVMSQLKPWYQTTDEIGAARARYENGLAEIESHLKLSDQAAIDDTVAAVNMLQPFYLPCQGKNDLDLQTKYGALVHKVMKAKYPQWCKDVPAAKAKPGGRIRIGFVSNYFKRHSVWNMNIGGWASVLDRRFFEVFAYFTNGIAYGVPQENREKFDHFVEADSFEQLCQRVRADDPHVLIFPEIGMDPSTLKMAALKLAPVQISSWGHPQTSGLPTIDYFLSSDLMESADADSYYFEKLIRLPNTGLYHIPFALELEPDTQRVETYLRPQAVRYLCVQTLHKYLPQYDHVFARIAARVPNSQFVFGGNPEGLASRLEERLRKVFDDAHLNFEEHVTILPPLTSEEFAGLCSLGGVFLDSLEWSGCNTTLQALEHNVVPVTLPGTFMRGRHTAAFLHALELPTVVESTDEYVELAVRLGLDETYIRELSEKIKRMKYRLYRDPEVITAFESFLKEIAS
jgi:predicted O-linked N-acetylglucosamine transferase (SPINDLY family)